MATNFNLLLSHHQAGQGCGYFFRINRFNKNGNIKAHNRDMTDTNITFKIINIFFQKKPVRYIL